MAGRELLPRGSAAKPGPVLEPWQTGSALGDFLRMVEPWEERLEPAGQALVRVAVVASVACFGSGLLLLLLGSAVVSSRHGLEHFFWIHPLGRWFVDVVGSLLTLWPFLIGAGLLGFVLACVLVTAPTGPRTRYAVLPMVGMAAIGCGPELFVAGLFVIQLALLLLLIAAGIAIVIALVAGLAS